MLKRLLQPGDGRRVPNDRDLALNLSLVLHERSDSKAVQRAVRAALVHASMQHRLGSGLSSPTTTSDYGGSEVNLWLTATLGLPYLLADALSTSPADVFTVDADRHPPQTVQFFRAPAMLSLPDDNQRRVGVAALILRPRQRTTLLAIDGIYSWPSERDAALRALERLIQAHAGQWMPSRALWDAPAESLLAAEIR